MKNQYHRTTRVAAKAGDRHRPAVRRQHALTCPRCHYAVGSFQTLASGHHEPCLGAGMPVTRPLAILKACGNYRLHIARRVALRLVHHQWADDGDALAAGWTPCLLRDRKQPVPAMAVDNSAASAAIGFCCRPVGKRIEVPVQWAASQDTELRDRGGVTARLCLAIGDRRLAPSGQPRIASAAVGSSILRSRQC